MLNQLRLTPLLINFGVILPEYRAKVVLREPFDCRVADINERTGTADVSNQLVDQLFLLQLRGANNGWHHINHDKLYRTIGASSEEVSQWGQWLVINGSTCWHGWRSTNAASFLRLYGSRKIGDH